MDEQRETSPLRPLDTAFAKMLLRRAGAEGQALEEAIAMACWAPSEGHLCADLEQAQADEVLRAPASLCRRPSERRNTPLVMDGNSLYLDRCWRDETVIVEAIENRAGAPTGIDMAQAQALTAEVFSTDPREESQRQAVKTALTSRLAIITGGPGTGKTTVVKRLLKCLERHSAGSDPPRVALCAPTGKAADRLAEQVGNDINLPTSPSTLHSLLGVLDLEAGRFRHGPSNPLPADLVVLDEASMVDASMMARLLSSLWPQTRIVLLGDPDQLRSVDYGAVLGDVCRAAEEDPKARHVARLTHVWRTDGAGIHALSSAIQRKDHAAAIAALTDQGLSDVELVEPPSNTAAGLETLLFDRVVGAWSNLSTLAPPEGLTQLQSLRILCAHRQGLRGVYQTNKLAQSWLAKQGHILPGSLWYEGRPILITRNDRGLDLRNGNVGLIREGQAWFDAGGLRSIPPSLLPDHETLYATTVHKAQGSEADEVIVLLPNEESPLLTRELLYTAVTRAVRRVTIVGTEDVVKAAIKTSRDRMSGIIRRLGGAPPPQTAPVQGTLF